MASEDKFSKAKEFTKVFGSKDGVEHEQETIEIIEVETEEAPAVDARIVQFHKDGQSVKQIAAYVGKPKAYVMGVINSAQ
jgi:hypothetical protein